jgi:hypothetical protein
MPDDLSLFDSAAINVPPEHKTVDLRAFGSVRSFLITESGTEIEFLSGDKLLLHPSVGFSHRFTVPSN